MALDMVSVVVGAGVGLATQAVVQGMTWAREEYKRRRDFRQLLVLLERELRITGILIEPVESLIPAGLPSFKTMVDKGLVDLLSIETRDHVLSAQTSLDHAEWLKAITNQLIEWAPDNLKPEVLGKLRGNLEDCLSLVRKEVSLASQAIEKDLKKRKIRQLLAQNVASTPTSREGEPSTVVAGHSVPDDREEVRSSPPLARGSSTAQKQR